MDKWFLAYSVFSVMGLKHEIPLTATDEHTATAEAETRWLEICKNRDCHSPKLIYQIPLKCGDNVLTK